QILLLEKQLPTAYSSTLNILLTILSIIYNRILPLTVHILYFYSNVEYTLKLKKIKEKRRRMEINYLNDKSNSTHFNITAHYKSSQHHNTLHISYFYHTFSYILKLQINRNKLFKC
ncbi:hypothetical protein V8G54_014045, partial [Vigna mungo]